MVWRSSLLQKSRGLTTSATPKITNVALVAGLGSAVAVVDVDSGFAEP